MTDFRFRRLAYVALRVRNAERSAAFLKDVIGLDEVAPAADGRRFFRCSDDHHNIALVEGVEPGIERLAFEMESECDLAAAEAQLSSCSLVATQVPDAECRALRQGRSVRFIEPATGLTLELIAGMQAHDTPFRPTLTKIARLV